MTNLRLSFILVGLLLGIALPKAIAQPSSQEVRLVFLVNDSPNMAAHDQADTRFTAVQSTLHWLAQFYGYFLCKADPTGEVQIYFSVIYFRGSPSIIPLNSTGNWVHLNSYGCAENDLSENMKTAIIRWDQQLTADGCDAQCEQQFGANYVATLNDPGNGFAKLLSDMDTGNSPTRQVNLFYVGDGLACGTGVSNDCSLVGVDTPEYSNFLQHIRNFTSLAETYRNDMLSPSEFKIHFLGFGTIFNTYAGVWEEATDTQIAISEYPSANDPSSNEISSEHLHATLRGRIIEGLTSVVAQLDRVAVIQIEAGGMTSVYDPESNTFGSQHVFAVPPLTQQMRMFTALSEDMTVNHDNMVGPYEPHMTDPQSKATAWLFPQARPENWRFFTSLTVSRYNLVNNDSVFVWMRPTQWYVNVYPVVEASVGSGSTNQSVPVYQYEEVRLVAGLAEYYPVAEYGLQNRLQFSVSIACPVEACSLNQPVNLNMNSTDYSESIYPREIGEHQLQFQIIDLQTNTSLSQQGPVEIDVALLDPVKLVCTTDNQNVVRNSEDVLSLYPGDRLFADVEFMPSGQPVLGRAQFPTYEDVITLNGKLVRRSTATASEEAFIYNRAGSNNSGGSYRFEWNRTRDDRTYQFEISPRLPDDFLLPQTSCRFDINYMNVNVRPPSPQDGMYDPVGGLLRYYNNVPSQNRQACIEIPNSELGQWAVSKGAQLRWEIEQAGTQIRNAGVLIAYNGTYSACVDLNFLTSGYYTFSYQIEYGSGNQVVMLLEPNANGAEMYTLGILIE